MRPDFTSLLSFADSIISLLRVHNINSVVYGSIALYYYTKDDSLCVNDVDVMVDASDYPKVMELLNEYDYDYSLNKDGELTITHKNLSIEIDYLGLGNEQLQKFLEIQCVQIQGFQIPIVSLKALEMIYSIAINDKNNSDIEKILKRVQVLQRHLGRTIRSRWKHLP